ncbi:MAG: hypothetical protein ACLUAM_08665 [Bifidobacterium adolescentis]
MASNNLQVSGDPRSNGALNDALVLGEEPASFYTDQLKASWQDDYHDVAIVMLAREGGEDKEMMMKDPEGISALSLHQDEKDLLRMIKDSGKFSKTIVLPPIPPFRWRSAGLMTTVWMPACGSAIQGSVVSKEWPICWWARQPLRAV